MLELLWLLLSAFLGVYCGYQIDRSAAAVRGVLLLECNAVLLPVWRLALAAFRLFLAQSMHLRRLVLYE